MCSSLIHRILRVALICAVLVACDDPTKQISNFHGYTMGTTYSVQIVDPILEIDRVLIKDRIDRILQNVNRKMSTYLDDSELSQFNANPSVDWVRISDELADVIRQALTISEQSHGAFDVTVGPLVNLWGFGPDSALHRIPNEQELIEALNRVGYKNLSMNDETHALKKKRSGVYIDLSGIAKGYAVDRIAEYLNSLGLQGYLVEIGGELRAKGVNIDGVAWRIAVEKPHNHERGVKRILSLSDSGIATSGDYRSFVEIDGKKYSHTIDPRTGTPVTHQLASITVVHNSAMTADAYATALMVLGPDKGYEFARHHRLAAYFILRQNGHFDERMTPQFERYVAP